MLETILDIFGIIIVTIAGIIGVALPIAITIGIPLLIIYAIYRAITGIMTHNAELKSRYGNRDER